MKITVIDGQGGNIGKRIVEEIKGRRSDVFITAIGTNSAATSAMMKGGADQGATGENPVAFCYYLYLKIMKQLPDYDRIFILYFL